ncbi:MAG: cation-translocating P-type ATPase [Acidobacteria bacterium]|nr:cation-translocating P-type ATPase [Acidobacteriota bacterium]
MIQPFDGKLAVYGLDVAGSIKALESDIHGLTGEEAAGRLDEFGPNELLTAVRHSPWSLLFDQFKNVLIIILLIATALSAVLGHGVEAIAITVIVMFAVLLGFVQEYRAEKAIEALKRMAAPTSTVLRDQIEVEVPGREIVPGDIILIRAGDKIPADARLIESHSLHLEEAALTGESVAVEKHTDALPGELSPGDRLNMAFAGTTATYGRGRAVVAATGMPTEFGKIARMLETVESSKTPLQQNLDRLGTWLARAALGIVAVIVVLGIFRGQPWVEMFVFGIALAVAVVPEALPAVVTISLAIGVQRMARRNALMRKLPAVETLGSTSVICTDKTGTLTRDEMTVRKIWSAGETFEVAGAGYEPVGEFSSAGNKCQPPTGLTEMLSAAVLASDARIEYDQTEKIWRAKGDPTEAALIVAAQKAGLSRGDLEEDFRRIAEIPFTSETKRMTTLNVGPNGKIIFAKGAPEIIVVSCSMVATADGEREMEPSDAEEILETARTFAEGALRVLAVARKKDSALTEDEFEMTFLGLVGMIDPPRPEARDAIETCKRAGIRTVLITGDHPLTAGAVAREIGLLQSGRIVTGRELDAMDDEVFAGEVENIEVYARVSPAHKLRVVTALQAKDHIVAMTGDGVNDAPALKKADIGIAMGITGTDVTKEAAAMTLPDDNFASIVAEVEEGRGIFGNIKKYLMYLLSCNIGEIGLMAGASLVGLPLPLTAVQLLYVNLATDGLPALALAVDPPEPDLMSRKPRDPHRGIFTRPVVTLMLVGGVWSAAVNMFVFWWALTQGRTQAEAMTMTFVTLVVIQFINAYNFRSDRLSILTRPFANKWLNIAISWEMLLLMAVLYVPFLQIPFGTFDLPATDWIFILGASATIVPVLEASKWMERRGWFGSVA